MRHRLGPLQELHLGQVTDNQDPEGRGRIQVRLHSTGMSLWATCLSPSAGHGYGISQLPRQDEQVVLAFVSPDLPIVLGAVWSGADSQPQTATPVEDKYALVTPAGNRLLIEDRPGARLHLETPSGHHITVSEASGGEITIEKGNERIRLDSGGITIETASQVEIKAGAQVHVSAPMVKVDAGMSSFSGVVQCDTLITNSVVSASYTPGAGNIW